MITFNHNLLASDTANSLVGHYSRLQTSTQRLSSGLRINSAADDAAGLAIRELMRSDIAALNQGTRNANDAISMIQTFDGALSVIDEKLIRMKELAEQASTGTYDSTQRLMIASEFQAMGEEINRIARSTDFNGIKLIDGEFAKAPTTVVGPDGKTYDISLDGEKSVSIWPGASATPQGGWDLTGITNPGALVGINDITITNDNIPKIGDNFLLVTPNNSTTNIPQGTTIGIEFRHFGTDPLSGTEFGVWTITYNGIQSNATGDGKGFTWTDPAGGPVHITTNLVNANGNSTQLSQNANVTWTAPDPIPSFSSNVGAVTSTLNGNELSLTLNLGGGNTISRKYNLAYGTNVSEPSTALASASLTLNIKDTTPVPGADEPQYTDPLLPNYQIPEDVVRIHFGTGADKKEDFYDINKYDCTLKGLGLEGIDIKTQDNAQNALVSVNEAIVAKDMIRAEYGATQNRLENTLTNIMIQAENLQASESRISDTEVAIEMMNFVRNQILTQSAVAMLAQANSVPQMVMSLVK